MKVSIVTISLNKKAGLEKTITSVRAQTYPDIEHIIVDGQSTDGTDELLRRLTPKYNVVKQPPKGVYAAINAGLNAASGDIIALLHAGDVYADNHVVADVVKNFESAPSTQYIYGNIRYLRRNGARGRLFSGAPASRKTLLTGFQPPHLSLFITRKAQHMVGLYSAKYRIAGDFEMFLRIFFNDNLTGKYMDRTMVNMEPNGLATRFISRLWTNNRERIKALRDNGLPHSPLAILKHYYYLFKRRK